MTLKKLKIRDVCLTTDYVANGSFASLKENVKYLDGDGYAVLVRLTDFTKNWKNSFRYVSKHAYEFLKHSKLYPGDLIISNVGEPGKTFLVPDLGKPATLGPNSILIRPDNSILSTQYLKYFIDSNSGQKLIDSIVSGTTQKKFNKTSLRNLEITIPSIKEQQRIVAKLDAVFAEIDKIKKFEETKLKENETLIQNFLDKIFKDNKNIHKLSDCAQIDPPKSEVNDLDDATEVSFMPMKDMGINNKLAISVQKRKLKDVKGSYTYFSEGDILLAKITPCFENGKMGIAYNLFNGIGFGSSEYIVFRPNKNLKNDWLYYFLNRNSFRIAGAQNMSGAVGHKRVDKDFIRNILIAIPSLEEQEKIISNLESLFNHSKAINKIILKKIDEMNHLKKAIMNKLLANKLVDAA